MHDAIFPAADFEVPIGQSVQAPASVLSVAPAFANLPAGQVFDVKGRQSDSLEDPVVILYLPAAQRVHDVWPVET